MGKVLESLTKEQIKWVNAQKIFFVATAPLSRNGHVNCSPKGGNSFRLISSSEFVYADYTGSAAETIAHILENGKICIMFCSFEPDPKIFRFHGTGKVISEEQPEFKILKTLFPERIGIRAFIKVSIERISSSCGEQVPNFSYIGEKDELLNWEIEEGAEGLKNYRRRKNVLSIDGISIPIFE